MATYDCKTEGCDGEVHFESDDHRPASKAPTSRDAQLVVIKDMPSACNKCGTSYYEHQFK